MTDLQIVSRTRPLLGHVDDYLVRFGDVREGRGRWDGHTLVRSGPDGSERTLLALEGPVRLEGDDVWRLALRPKDPDLPALALARHIAAICDGSVFDARDGRRVA
jgi:hypothetical protein